MPRKSLYTIDLNIKEGHEGYGTIINSPSPLNMKQLQQVEVNMKTQGISSSTKPALTIAQQNTIATKKNKMAMSIATKPGQALLMNALMLWFSGNQLNIFSIQTTSSAIMTPLSNIFTIETIFGTNQFKDIDIQIPKLLFIGLNVVWLCIGLYKMSSMRLLPTTSADWTYKIQWKDVIETTSIPPLSS